MIEAKWGDSVHKARWGIPGMGGGGRRAHGSEEKGGYELDSQYRHYITHAGHRWLNILPGSDTVVKPPYNKVLLIFQYQNLLGRVRSQHMEVPQAVSWTGLWCACVEAALRSALTGCGHA